jgi:hypothetical protein
VLARTPWTRAREDQMSRWATVAPVNPEWRGPTFDVAEEIDIGWGVHLVPLPAWLKQQNITRYMSWVERERYINEGKFALSVEYEAESLGEPDPQSNMGPMSKQHVAAERLRRANLALWLARPSWAGFPMVISAHEDQGDWVHRETYPTDTIRPIDRDAANALSRADFSLAKKLGDAASTLSIRASTWVAMMLLWRALTEWWWESRYLLLWVALEALFGSGNPNETTYRLSQRLAFFLAEDRSKVRSFYDRAKAGYSARSKVVHGFQHLSLVKEKADSLLADTEFFVRAALCKILMDAGHLRTFAGKQQREDFLDGLVFG